MNLFLAKYKVIDVKLFSKLKWKAFVLEKIKELNRHILLEERKQYKKMEGFKDVSRDVLTHRAVVNLEKKK